MITRFLEHASRRPSDLALADPAGTYDYATVMGRVRHWSARLAQEGVPPGAVVTVEGDYGLETVAAFVAAVQHRAILVPLSKDSQVLADTFREVAEVEWRVVPAAGTVERNGGGATHEFFGRLREIGAPGLVLFSSGSTGKNKAAVHDLAKLMKKFEVPRHAYRTLVFLQLDHIGGVNTLFYTLANGGAVVAPADRAPAIVAAAIAQHRVELLPTSPTFLNLLLLSGEHERHDLSSLRLITYGTEPMPETTLQRVAAAFPAVTLQQTYGLTEIGILRSKSRGNGSLWVRVGGEGYQTKILDGRLWVKAESAMLGYLNAPAPFDEEGYFDTGDRVEVDGEWLRILGRESEIINVGGSKVYPSEVEAVLLDVPNVADAVVYGEPHPMTGQIVTATVRLRDPEPLDVFKVRMRVACSERLARYKVPARVRLSDGPLHSERFKRRRRAV
jgi:acyl-CoA synthetase (AMP-forming)/AMP-acid ligase II